MTIDNAWQTLVIKIMDGITYLVSAFSVFVAFLDQHAAGFGVLIAFLTYITSTLLNNHWQRKRYKLELMRLQQDADDE